MNSQEWKIGRINSSKNTILLANNTVSNLHATLKFNKGCFFIKDENSTNGTYIIRQGDIIIVKSFVELFANDYIVFGDVQYSVESLLDKLSSLDLLENDIREDKKSFVNTKKIRCIQCMKPIDANQPCPSCESIEHMHMKEFS